MSQDNQSPPPEALKGGPLIAVIDDDDRVLESLEDLLQSSGYRTLRSLSAEEFLQSSLRPQVRALISDIGLPGMSGIELIRTLRQSSQDLPSILITGRTDAHLKQNAGDLGLLRFLAKPFDANELLDILAQLHALSGCADAGSTPASGALPHDPAE